MTVLAFTIMLQRLHNKGCTQVEVCVWPHLHGRLREVVWVPEFGGYVEAEVLGVLDGAVAQLDTDAAPLLKGLLQQQRLQDWIQLLPNVLQQHGGAKLDAVLESADKVAVGELDDVEVARLLHVLDPLVGLALRVNH